MSMFKAGKVSLDVKSRAKSVLSTLERLSSSNNPDKDQTRYLCHKLLQLVNEQETSKNDVTSKAGLDIILLTLESCNDQATCHALVSTLSELASEGQSSLKRLISHDASRVLLHTLSYMGSELDWRLLSAIISLLFKLAPKDRRFALRARLTGALPMILTAVRSSHNHQSRSRLFPTALAVLKACVTNSPANASLLGRAGGVNVLFKVSTSLSKKQPLPLKTSLATLNLMIRLSRANASRATNLGVMSHMMAMHLDYHKSDFNNNRHVAIRKSILNIIKNTAVLKVGRKAFISSNGMRALYTSCKDYLGAGCTSKSIDCLLGVAILILRRCQQKCRLPVPNLRCTFQFPLPGGRERSGSATSADILLEESEDDEDFEEDEDACFSGAVGDQDDVGEATQNKRRGSVVSKTSSASDSSKGALKRGPVLRSYEDLKMYEPFFPELTDFPVAPAETPKQPDLSTNNRPHSSCEVQHDSGLGHYGPIGHYSYPDLTRASRCASLPRTVADVSSLTISNPWEIPHNVTATAPLFENSGVEEREKISPRSKVTTSACQGIHGTAATLVTRQLSPRRASLGQFNFNSGDDANAVLNKRNPTTAWGKTSASADDVHSLQKTFALPQISQTAVCESTGVEDILGDFKRLFERGLNEEHEESLNHMRELATKTISAKEVENCLSLADQWGSSPPLRPEPQVNKKSLQKLIKTKVLEDVARSLSTDGIINRVVYPVVKETPLHFVQEPVETFVNGALYHCDVRLPDDENVTQDQPTITIPTGLQPAEGIESLEDKDESKNHHLLITDMDSSSATLSEETWPGVYLENGPKTIFARKETPFNPPDGFALTNGNDQQDDVDTFPNITSALNFNSGFESGNLRSVTRIREFEYDLVLNSDCNSNHHFQWFYFEVSGMVTSRPYRFNIVNCEKKGSIVNEGMQPVMYSMVEAMLGRPCWRRAGRETCYYRNHFLRHSTSAGATKSRTYFTLTFTVTFQHEEDVCYLAYHYPYTYTKLKMDLDGFIAGVDPRTMFVKNQQFCTSLAGNPLPLLTITALPKSDGIRSYEEAVEEMKSRPYIFLTARVHPGESNASWTMRGTLRLLLTPPPPVDFSGVVDDAKHTLAAVADELRRSYIFKIVPMLNPDGVINGHHRCSLSGEDLNRTWIDPDRELFPTIYHTKGLLQYLQTIQKAPLVYCDYHGHSRKMNVFLYGCSHRDSIASGEASTVVDGPDDAGYKTLPKLLNHLAPTFSLKNCSFVVERSKMSTARVVVWKEIGVTRSYTMESTYCGCDQGQFRGKQICTRELEDMGSRFCEVLLHLKARNKTRGLPVFELDDDGFVNNQETNEDDEILKHQHQTPGCPANSDAELTPDEEDPPLNTTFVSDDFFSPSSGEESPKNFHLEHPSSSKTDLSFWRYDPGTLSAADFGNEMKSSNFDAFTHAARLPPRVADKFSPRPVRDDRGHLPVINAKVSPETGRLISYDYGESDTDVATAPRPFESGLVLRREKSLLLQPDRGMPSELSITPLTTLGRGGVVDAPDLKTARARRRAMRR